MQSLIKLISITILLSLSNMMMAQAPDWDIDPSDYDFNMRLTLNLNVGCGGAAPSGPYTVAVYVDGVLAGVETVNGSTAFLTIYSNDAIGGDITFQVFDSATDELLDYGSNLSFVANQLGTSLSIGDGGNGNADGDAFCDDEDPCPDTFQAMLSDRDGDGIDDACDAYPDDDNRNDSDGDGIPDTADDDDCGCNSPSDLIEVCENGVNKRVPCSRLSDNRVVCGDCFTCGNSPCEDGDPCTTGETWDEFCRVCSGGVAKDSDQDGVCDALDECPGQDDNRDFDNDGIPDACDNDPACYTCEPDVDGDITFCWVYPNGRMSSFKGNCNLYERYFDENGDFRSKDAHCGPCTCASIGDVDSDGDGVCDSKDECPENPDIWLVGACSCDAEDDDGDGEADSCLRTICSTEGNSTYEWIESITVNNTELMESQNRGYVNHGMNRAIFTSRNEDISLSVKPTCIGMDCHLSYAVYADWNDDKDFNDEDEVVVMHRGTGGLEVTFSIPENAVAEPMIRVITDYGRITGPCDDHIEGEVEDMMLNFYEDCEVIQESFDYAFNSALDGLGDDSMWEGPWAQDENSIGVSSVLQQSLYHPDVTRGEGGKLGLLNISNTNHTISRSLSGPMPFNLSFLYMRSGGKGTFKLKIGEVLIYIDENGNCWLNGEKAPNAIDMNKVYRFALTMDYDDNGNLAISLKYDSESIGDSSTQVEITISETSDVTGIHITTENSNDFLPIAQYLDDIRISCDPSAILSIDQNSETAKNELKKSFGKLDLKVFPNPVSRGKVYVQLQNHLFFDGSIQVTDMNGRLVLTREATSGSIKIDLDNFQSGVYMITARSSNQVAQRKMVVQ